MCREPETAVTYRGCQCCPRQLRDNRRTVCEMCQDRIATALVKIEGLWARLPEQLIKGGGTPADPDVPRSPGPTGSAAPANLHALNLLAGEVTGKLLVHEDDWRRQLRTKDPLAWRLTPQRGTQDETFTGVMAFLRGNLHWACHAIDFDVHVDDLDHDVSWLLDDMDAAVTGDRRRPHPIAVPCPLSVPGPPGEDGRVRECGGELVFYPKRKQLRCRSCRQTAGPGLWADVALAAGLRTADNPAPNLTDFLNPSGT